MPDESLPPRPPSLRDLYTPQHTDWSFNPASSPGSSANGASSSSAWSSRAPPPKHRVLELSPYPLDELEGAGEYILDTRGMIKVLIGNALLQYATTGIAMPFEVAKILMQCQWIPRELAQDGPEEVIIEVPEELEQDSVQSF
jgi:mitochondrial fusion and transport protein UGO1